MLSFFGGPDARNRTQFRPAILEAPKTICVRPSRFPWAQGELNPLIASTFLSREHTQATLGNRETDFPSKGPLRHRSWSRSLSLRTKRL